MRGNTNRPATLAGKVFRAGQAVGLGVTTRNRLRSAAWHRLFRGVYADSRVTLTHRLRCRAALEFLAPPQAVIAGRSAAQLYAAAVDDPAAPVEILVPRDQRFGPVHGLLIHTSALDSSEVVHHLGVAMTSAVRTCWDLAQWLDPVEAVVRIDRLLAADRVRPDELAEYQSLRPGDRGCRRFATAVALADGRSESPQESRLRVRLRLAGIAGMQPQYEICDERGRFLARVDLALPQPRIALEYDGVGHVGSATQMNRDRERLNRLLAAGWLVLHVTSPMMRDGFPDLLGELRAAIRARRQRR